MTNLVTLGYGRETFASVSASVAAYSILPAFVRQHPGKSFTRQGKMQVFNASNYPEINGKFFLDSLIVPTNTVLLLQSSHTNKSVCLRNGAVFIQVRPTAPLWAIHASLPPAIGASMESFSAFQGKGDILTLEDLDVLEIAPPKNWVNNYMDEEEVAECFTFMQIAPATEEKRKTEVVEDREGNKVVTMQRPTRKISLRRPA